MDQAVGYVVGFAIAVAPAALAVVAANRLSRRSVEEWRLLAWVPPIPLAAWWVYFLISVIRDPSSHNLWPFEMIGWSVVSAALFAVFLIGRKLAS